MESFLPDHNKKDIMNENPHQIQEKKRIKQTIVLPSGEKIELKSDNPEEMKKEIDDLIEK